MSVKDSSDFARMDASSLHSRCTLPKVRRISQIMISVLRSSKWFSSKSLHGFKFVMHHSSLLISTSLLMFTQAHSGRPHFHSDLLMSLLPCVSFPETTTADISRSSVILQVLESKQHNSSFGFKSLRRCRRIDPDLMEVDNTDREPIPFRVVFKFTGRAQEIVDLNPTQGCSKIEKLGDSLCNTARDMEYKSLHEFSRMFSTINRALADMSTWRDRVRMKNRSLKDECYSRSNSFSRFLRIIDCLAMVINKAELK